VSLRQTGRSALLRRDTAVLAALLLLCVASVPGFDAADAPGLRSSDAVALLRAARAAKQAGDLEVAADLLERVAREHPIVGDHASALRAHLLTQSGHEPQAAAVLLEALAAYPKSPLRAALFRELGAARLSLGDEGGARAAWTAALRTQDKEFEAELLFSLAESFRREEMLDDAFERYREVWFSHPTSEFSAAATARLDELEKKLGDELRVAEDWRRRADRLFRAHYNEAALHDYDHALALGLSPSGVRRAGYQRAHTLFRMRRYDEAVNAFASLPVSADQRLWHARSLARANRVMEAVDEFEKLSSEGHADIGLRAVFLAGLLLEGRDFHERARAHFETVASSRRYPGLAHGALWRLAWREFQDADYEAALPRLERLVEIESDPIDALRWRYWRARCLEQLGRPGAIEEFVALATDFPFTYYGWRSSFRVESAELLMATDVAARDLGPRKLPEAVTERARILISAGYPELARDELRGLRAAARSPGLRLELAGLLSDAGDFNGAQRVVVDAHLLELARGPSPRREELWWYAWPAAFGGEVAHASSLPGAAAPELVYAIMREESGYRPKVRSVSGAYGLMQIMPATGERLARDARRTGFVPDDLFDPSVNVELGARFLGELGDRFPERPSAAIASYNAGPEAVRGWLADDPARADDEWVEAIPYDQTRRYVKRVLRSLHVYRVLY